MPVSLVVGHHPISPLYQCRVFFLVAFVLIWWFSASTAVCFRCSTPSGHVPGGGAAVLGGDGFAVEKEQREALDLIAF
jgi:hypothetical protein